MSASEMIKLILYAVAMAMGVAVTVLSVINNQDTNTTLLGIGIFCLALAGLNSINDKKL